MTHSICGLADRVLRGQSSRATPHWKGGLGQPPAPPLHPQLVHTAASLKLREDWLEFGGLVTGPHESGELPPQLFQVEFWPVSSQISKLSLLLSFFFHFLPCRLGQNSPFGHRRPQPPSPNALFPRHLPPSSSARPHILSAAARLRGAKLQAGPGGNLY